MRKINKIIFLASSLLFHGCFIYGKKEMLSLDSVVKNKVVLNSKLTSVNVSNNQITINGSGFSKVTSVKIKGSGVDQTLAIDSKSDSQIVTLATNTLSLLVGGTFDLIIGTVDAQATYAVTFTLQNGAIQASHLSSMGASSGQILKYNGTSWAPVSQIDAQIYMGTWDATTTIPDVTLSSAGDYYIVSVAGGGYAVGDWIISDGYDWTKVAYSKTSVSSFNGRKGIVTLTAADYLGLKDGTTHKITGSSLNDIADVDLTGAASGNFLKYNGTNWVPASAVGGGSIGAADIAAGVIDDSHVSATAAIAQSKIANLTTDLTAKQNTSSLATDVKAVTLTGLTSNTGSVAATDTIFGAFRKLMNVSGDYVSASAGASIVTGTIAVSGTGMITVPLASGTTSTEVANVTYVGNAIAANGVWTKNANGVDIGYTAGKVGIGTTSPNTLLNIGSGTPTTATNGIQFGSDVSANLYRYSPGIIRSDGWIFGVSGFGGAIAQANTLYPLSAQDLVIQTRATGSNNIIFKSVGTTPTETMRMDTNGNIGIGTPAPTSRIHGDTTLSVATGNEVAYELDYTTNKATSGNDTGLKINMTDTLSPGTSYLIDAQVGGVSKFKVDNAGAMTITGQLNTGVLASSSTLVGGYLSVAGANMGTSGTVRVASTNILDEDISYIKISPTYNKPTATSRANTDLLINRTETSLGTTPGTQFLIDAQVAGVSKFNVSNAGNVGVGTTTPIEKLDVVGNSSTDSSTIRIINTGSLGSSGGAGVLARTNTDPTASGQRLGYFLFGAPSSNTAGLTSFSEEAWTGSARGTNLVFETVATGSTTRSEKMRISATGNVGIGTTSPVAKLHVSADGASISSGITSSFANPVILSSASGALDSYLVSASNTATTRSVYGTVRARGTVGTPTAVQTDDTLGTFLFGGYDGSQVNFAAGLFAYADGNAASGNTPMRLSFVTGNNGSDRQERIVIKSSGNVGIGTTAPAYKLDVNGTLNVSGATTNVSDLRFKKEIQKIPDALEKISAIDGVTYKFKNEEFPDRDFSHRREMGVIAQTVEKVFPEAVSKDQKGYRSVAYTMLIAPVIEAIKQLSSEFKALVARVFSLEDKSKKLEAENKEIKAENKEIKAENKELKKENNLIKLYLCSKDKSAAFCK